MNSNGSPREEAMFKRTGIKLTLLVLVSAAAAMLLATTSSATPTMGGDAQRWLDRENRDRNTSTGEDMHGHDRRIPHDALVLKDPQSKGTRLVLAIRPHIPQPALRAEREPRACPV